MGAKHIWQIVLFLFQDYKTGIGTTQKIGFATQQQVPRFQDSRGAGWCRVSFRFSSPTKMAQHSHTQRLKHNTIICVELGWNWYYMKEIHHFWLSNCCLQTGLKPLLRANIRISPPSFESIAKTLSSLLVGSIHFDLTKITEYLIVGENCAHEMEHFFHGITKNECTCQKYNKFLQPKLMLHCGAWCGGEKQRKINALTFTNKCVQPLDHCMIWTMDYDSKLQHYCVPQHLSKTVRASISKQRQKTHRTERPVSIWLYRWVRNCWSGEM